MRRRSKWLALLLLVAGLAAAAGAVVLTARREPEFYTRAGAPADWETQERAARLPTRLLDLKNEVRSKAEWGDTFTAAELNAFFAEHMCTREGFGAALPEKLRDPRVAVDGDRVKVGFRYGEGLWSAVVWVEFRVWLVKDEVNLAAVEVCDLRAGRLPLGTQSILDAVGEAARAWNIDVTWYRNEGNPVGLFRFFADQPGNPPTQVLTLEAADGRITVAGRSNLNPAPRPE
ncbi:MAG TPA: hypothetical protein VH092_13230 [Urbifossiella sp.]|jgi:hypothetical protein|nr:hypothetical protein [Urbifossiella sp.]